jgi:hypothetical protein
MELQKISVKVFAAEPHNVPLTDFIDIFHGWIQASDGIYHDVVDYSHMRAGPGIVLVADDANLSIDETGNRRGLLWSQKGRLAGSNQEKLRAVLRSALENCRRLEQEPSLHGRLRFLPNEAVISVNDRLIAPNTHECFLEIKPEIESLGRTLFGDAKLTLERDLDARKRLKVHMKSSHSADLETVLSYLRDQ